MQASGKSPARNRMREALIEVEALREEELCGEETQPRIVPEYGSGEVLKRLHPRLREALGEAGVLQLYTHQEDAIEAGLAGANVVLQAPTASGKSLAFQVPMMDKLLKDPSAKALLVYPMKALFIRLPEQTTGRVGGESRERDAGGEAPASPALRVRGDRQHRGDFGQKDGSGGGASAQSRSVAGKDGKVPAARENLVPRNERREVHAQGERVRDRRDVIGAAVQRSISAGHLPARRSHL